MKPIQLVLRHVVDALVLPFADPPGCLQHQAVDLVSVPAVAAHSLGERLRLDCADDSFLAGPNEGLTAPAASGLLGTNTRAWGSCLFDRHGRWQKNHLLGLFPVLTVEQPWNNYKIQLSTYFSNKKTKRPAQGWTLCVEGHREGCSNYNSR